MTRNTKGARGHCLARPKWEYPHDFSDDPKSEDDRRKMDDPKEDAEARGREAVSAYWLRRAEFAADWCKRNSDAPQAQYDQAWACEIAARRSAAYVGSPDPPVRREHFEALFRETKNPLYMWQAVTQALTGWDSRRATVNDPYPEPPPLPPWCVAPLRLAARSMIRLHQPYLDPPSSAALAAALGLISQGRSAYSQRTRDDRNRERERFVEELVKAGMPLMRARKVVFPEINDDRSHRARKPTPRKVRPLSAAKKSK